MNELDKLLARHPKMGERSLRILELAERIDGVTAAEAYRELGGAKESCSSACSWLADRGFLFRAKVRGDITHFFITERAADRWLERQGEPRKVPVDVVKGPTMPKLQPSVNLTKPGGPKHTYLPAPEIDVRFQVEPGTRVLGGFATMGIGRYLPETPHA